MGSTAEAVRRCIEEDVFLQEALARGIVRYREMARWLQENRGVDGTVSSIAQAIQRNEPDDASEALTSAWENLQTARIDTRGGLASLELDRSQAVVDGLHSLLEDVNPARGDSFRVHHDASSLTLVFEETHLEEVADRFHREALQQSVEGLAELAVLPSKDRRLHPATVSLTVACLSVNGHQPILTIAEGSSISLLVDGGESREAFALLGSLTE